jgi:hypothetical protein
MSWSRRARFALEGTLVLVAWACSSSGPGDDPAASSRADAAPAPQAPEGGGDAGAQPSPRVEASADAGADAGAADAPATGSARGLPCSREDDLGGGRRSCLTKVGSVELRIVTPLGGAGPMRLGLHLHGDGAVAHLDNSALAAMIPWVDAQRGIGVSALAPNGCAWWLKPSYDCASDPSEPDVDAENVAPLAAALDAVMVAYDVRTDGLRYYGASGGSIFLTGEWLPLEGARYPGVFAIMCGGSAPRPFAWDAGDAALRDRSTLAFTYGEADPLLSEIRRSIDALSGKMFAIRETILSGPGHCAFDTHAAAVAIWSATP